MADIVLTGDTSGSITIAAPSVAGTNTLTLPASTGTVLTSASPQSGGVIQVVSANRNGEQSTTSSSFVDASLSVSITPKFATSKIFAIYTGSAGTNHTQEAYLTIVRSATNLGNGTQGLMRIWKSVGGGYMFGGFSMSFLDSPATTSATTYKIQFRSDGSNQVYISGGASTDTLTVMEIAA